MQASLSKLRELPDETVVYCAHEYTSSNVRFAVEVYMRSLLGWLRLGWLKMT